MPEDLGDKGITKEWTQSLVMPLPKRGNLKVRIIVPSAYSAIPARLCSELSPTDSRPRLRNCWQKNKQVLDQAGAQ